MARFQHKDHLLMSGILAMWRTWAAAERLKPPVDRLTAEERTEMVRAETATIIDKHPDAVLLVAATMPGWTVIPPPGVDLGDLAGEDA